MIITNLFFIFLKFLFQLLPIFHVINLIIVTPLTIFTLFLIFAGLHLKLGLGEIIEDYIQDERLKGVLNKITMLYSAILPIVGIVSLIIIIL